MAPLLNHQHDQNELCENEVKKTANQVKTKFQIVVEKSTDTHEKLRKGLRNEEESDGKGRRELALSMVN